MWWQGCARAPSNYQFDTRDAGLSSVLGLAREVVGSQAADLHVRARSGHTPTPGLSGSSSVPQRLRSPLSDNIDVSFPTSSKLRRPRSRRRSTSAPPIDHTRWMAVVIELVAIVAAVVFAYQHAKT
jgi:hypothetical protein